MQTDDLIARLASDLPPVSKSAMLRLLLGGVALGAIGSALVMLVLLGPRHDFQTLSTNTGLWMKLAYTLALAGFGLWLVERAGRPGASVARPLALLALPLAAIAVLAGMQMAAPDADMERLVMGQSSRMCALNILMVAAPTLAAAFLVLRRMAPTRLALAGAGAGLLAGAAGAFVYAFHCTEAAAPFVALWYTLGIALTAVIGAFLGRYLLRW